MPKRVDHQQRRECIASALMRVAARDGLEGISLRQVAAEAGVTSGMVQHYFPSKDAMMHYAMDAASDYFANLDELAPRAWEDLTIQEHIFTLLCSLLPMDHQRRNAGLATLAFTAYAATNQAAARKLAWGNTQLREYIGQLLDTAARDGLLVKGVETGKAATVVLATTEGLGLHCLTGGLEPESAAAALQHHVSSLFIEQLRGDSSH